MLGSWGRSASLTGAQRPRGHLLPPTPQCPRTAGRLLCGVAPPRPRQGLQRVLGFVPGPSLEGGGWMRDLGGGWGGGEASPAARRRPPCLSPEVKTTPICWGPETWLEDATKLQKIEPGLAIQVSPLTSFSP